MRRTQARAVAVLAAAAIALGCKPAAPPRDGGTTLSKGKFGEYWYVTLSRPEQGTVSSSDGRITCGVAGGICGDSLMQTRYDWSQQSVTLSAVAAPKYHFQEWMGDCSGRQPTCVLHAGADRYAVAYFAPDAVYEGVYFTVSVERPIGGKVVGHFGRGVSCGATGTDADACGPVPVAWADAATLTAVPDDGYVVRGWTGDCSGKGTCVLDTSVHPTDKVVGARFLSAKELLGMLWDEDNWDEAVWQ
jgi:List-Bact-rpt repeat protein